MWTKHCKAIGPPKSDNLGPYTTVIKLDVNQANAVVHIQNGPGKTDEGNSTCGALFPAVTIAFGIQLARSLSFFLSFVLSSFFISFFLSFSPSLYLCVVLWQISFEQCDVLEGRVI